MSSIAVINLLLAMLAVLSITVLVLLLERWAMARTVATSRRQTREVSGRLARGGDAYQSLLANVPREMRGLLVDERASTLPGLDPLTVGCMLVGLAVFSVLTAWVLLPIRVVISVGPRTARFFDSIAAFAAEEQTCTHCGRDGKVLGKTAHSVWFYCECGHHWRAGSSQSNEWPLSEHESNRPVVAGVSAYH